jgi:NAD(P)H-hydrate epimerase
MPDMNKCFDDPIDEVPDLDTEQMIEVDRAMIEDYEIELIQMMENAGRNLAHLARERFLEGSPRGKRVVVLAGRGGNGGGALVCARRLSNWGALVEVHLTKELGDFKGVPAHQLGILSRMRLTISPPGGTAFPSESSDLSLVVDGVIGYSLSGAPRGQAAEMIRWANGHPAPVLALDAPSGLDTATGEVFDPTINATATLTLALPKRGLRSRAQVGELYLADISVPPALYEQAFGFEVGPLFAECDVIRLG